MQAHVQCRAEGLDLTALAQAGHDLLVRDARPIEIVLHGGVEMTCVPVFARELQP
jgi:hypothetical protein